MCGVKGFIKDYSSEQTITTTTTTTTTLDRWQHWYYVVKPYYPPGYACVCVCVILINPFVELQMDLKHSDCMTFSPN